MQPTKFREWKTGYKQQFFFFLKKDEKKKDEEIKRNINNSQTCLNPKFEQYKIKMTGEMWIK